MRTTFLGPLCRGLCPLWQAIPLPVITSGGSIFFIFEKFQTMQNQNQIIILAISSCRSSQMTVERSMSLPKQCIKWTTQFKLKFLITFMYDGDTWMSCVTTADWTKWSSQKISGLNGDSNHDLYDADAVHFFFQHFISIGLLLGNYRLKGFRVKDKIITDK